MIFGVEGIDKERRARLIELLDIDVDWSMMTVSDGQRRRVQICMGLLKPFKVLLCDEITVDLALVYTSSCASQHPLLSLAATTNNVHEPPPRRLTRSR